MAQIVLDLHDFFNNGPMMDAELNRVIIYILDTSPIRVL